MAKCLHARFPKDVLLICSSCHFQAVSPSIGALLKHKNHTSRFKCLRCQTTFKRLTRLLDHQGVPYCKHCLKICFTNEQLRAHLKSSTACITPQNHRRKEKADLSVPRTSCPYYPTHQIRPPTLENWKKHLATCPFRPGLYSVCPYDSNHRMPRQYMAQHLLRCSARPKSIKEQIQIHPPPNGRSASNHSGVYAKSYSPPNPWAKSAHKTTCTTSSSSQGSSPKLDGDFPALDTIFGENGNASNRPNPNQATTFSLFSQDAFSFIAETHSPSKVLQPFSPTPRRTMYDDMNVKLSDNELLLFPFLSENNFDPPSPPRLSNGSPLFSR